MQTFEAALSEANALHKAGRIPEAVKCYETLLQTSPNHAKILYFAGAAYASLGRFEEAISALQRSLIQAPRDLNAIEMLGSTWMQVGQPAKALPYFRDAAALAPRPEAQLRFATALTFCKRYDEALSIFQQMRASGSSDPQVDLGFALCLAELGKAELAEQALRASIALRPDHGKTCAALGNLLAQAELYGEAEAIARQFLERQAGDLEMQRLLANVLHKQGRLAESEAAYREALRGDPRHVRTLCQLGEALIDLHRLDDAESELQRALSFQPANVGALTALGRVYELRGALDSALALHDRALSLEPTDLNALINRGTAWRFLGKFDKALADYDAALAVRPSHPAARASRALCLLTLGRLSEAWPHYRARIKARAGAVDLAGANPWDGASIAGKKVLVWTEYGLGDEILFASLIPEVLAIARECTLVCSPRLVGIFSRSFPELKVLAWDAPLGDEYDVRMPLTDVAQLLRPSLASFPAHQGYLHVDDKKVAALKARYQRRPGQPVVGISWHSAAGPIGRFKSADLTQWSDVLHTPGVSFVSLQYGDSADEVRHAKAESRADLTIDPDIDAARDIEGFAAQVAAMDLVVSVSNTTVHVAGALGRPTWMLAPTGPGMHWYWFLHRSDSLWYPSVRLFRQTTPMDWTSPLRAVATELRQKFAAA